MSYFGIAPYPSTNNATATPLGASATYTGTWERATRSMVLVQSFSDQAGTLYFDFSVDGTNADSTYPVNGVAAAANVPTVQPAAVSGRYFRVRYVNGSVAQTVFRLEASYSEISNFYTPVNNPYSLQSPSILTRTTPPGLDIARGLVGGVTVVHKFGRNDSVGTIFVPISFGGVYNMPQAAAATTLRVKSGGNANDTAAGSGAREITLEGLDETFTEVTEAVATAGAGASSATTATFTRLFRAYVSSSGTYATSASGSHAGDIVIENGAGGTDWTTIDSTGYPKSQTEIGAYSVAANKTAFVRLVNVSVDSGKTVDLIFSTRANADDAAAPYSAFRTTSEITSLVGGSIEKFGTREANFGPYIGPYDFLFMAKVSTGTASVSVEFEILIFDE